MSDKNYPSHLERGKGYHYNVCNSNSYIVAVLWKAPLTRNSVMFRKGFCDIPGQNVGCQM